MRMKNSRSAFTLIDLVVLCFVVAFLVGLLIPAANSMRESTRRRQCISNSQKIAQASLNYESTYQSFPSAAASCTNEAWHSTGSFAQNVCTSPNWVSVIMDFLDQRAIGDSLRKCMLHHHQAVEDCAKEPLSIGTTTPGVLKCPSSFTLSRNFGSKLTGLRNLSKGNYAGCMGASLYLHSIEQNRFVDEKLRREYSEIEIDSLKSKRGIITVSMIPGWETKVRHFHHGGHG